MKRFAVFTLREAISLGPARSLYPVFRILAWSLNAARNDIRIKFMCIMLYMIYYIYIYTYGYTKTRVTRPNYTQYKHRHCKVLAFGMNPTHDVDGVPIKGKPARVPGSAISGVGHCSAG